MVWLIWIGLMLAIPVLAGITVWVRLQREYHNHQNVSDDGASVLSD